MVAPSTSAASSRVPGTACSRAVRKRKANGNERQASNTITVSNATGMPSTVRPSLRKAIGESQPSSRVPQWLATPNCGLSIVFQANVTATIGVT